MQYFEDIEVGDVDESGEYDVTKAEIVEFAEQYDPQPFHVDEEAAADSMFGELVASGWHTASIMMRLGVESSRDRAFLGSFGVDELRWKAPVKPGDTLRRRSEVIEKRPSESRDDRGYVKLETEGFNQDDEVVITMIGNGIIARRPDDE
ncbi:MaoC family dehydratase [Natrarchaeobaculum aegyptiacum]|uniref:Acyl dehydratase n=1 Tax=Natrarchaeobaculum aegyptiacum TaxID=745377 RepID=A0A2Z2HXT1_9EURY|nr:MaoC family dehydratase [Natrarchaeobaculum aegyptiacum]ARS90497.1 acyl dehydratase [Natrarchaeobaculum aegyptiacum]